MQPNDEPAICEHCGDEYLVDLVDVWAEDRAFQLDFCCEAAQDEFYAYELRAATREDWRAFFRDRAGIEIRDVHETDDCATTGWAIDFGLRLEPIDQATAKAFVRANHRHNPPPAGWRWGHGVYNGHDLVGVAMVGRPVARRLDPAKVVEVNRVCVTAHPYELAEHACSMLYGAACREAKRRGFELVVTYTLDTEPGTSVKAAGFTAAAKTKGGTWNRPSRARTDKAPTIKKTRWERRVRG